MIAPERKRAQSRIDQRFLTPGQAAHYLNISRSTLRKHDVKPMYMGPKTPRYDIEALRRWSDEKSGINRIDQKRAEEDLVLAALGDDAD